MGIVKYTGPVASFHCPTNAEIRSLKVHFSPKQEGSGDPSPENVRPIVGWDGVEVYQRGKNLLNFGTQTFTTYQRIYLDAPLKPGTYKLSATITSTDTDSTWSLIGFWDKLNGKVLSQPILRRNERTSTTITLAEQCTLIYLYASNSYANGNEDTSTWSEIQLEVESNATNYEPYHGSTTNYEFGVLGKNKFNWNVEQGHASPVTSDYTTARSYPLNTYIIGMSSSNYYRDNYTNWVLNPSVSNGTISFSSGGASGYGIGYPLKLMPNQTYFLSGETTNNGLAGTIYYDKDGALISTQGNRLNKTITIPDNTVTTMIVFYSNVTNTSYTFSNIQLELGSTATEYEPYDPNHTVYGGWVDLITGEVQEEYCDYILNGTESRWSLDGSGDIRRRAYHDTAILNGIAKPKGKLYCSYCSTGSSSTWYGWISSSGSSTSCHILFYIPATIDTTDKWKEYLNENPLQICYELATPITYHLAPTQLQTFLGQNNVWSNADYVEVEYDLHETQDILNRKNFIIANQPHIVKPAAAPIQSFTTDVPAPLKECKVHFEPIQDLHGYDRPWVGGSGKNLLNISTNNKIGNSNFMSTVTETETGFNIGDSTVNGGYWVPVKPNTTYTYSYTSTYNGSSMHGRVRGLTEKTNQWDTDSNSTFLVNKTSWTGSATFTTGENTNWIIVGVYAYGAGLNSSLTNMQIEEGSTATSYEPYENICPIEGWDELELYLRGVNFQDEIWEVGQISNTTGEQLTSNDSIITTNYIPVPMNTNLNVVIPENTSVKIAGYDKNKQFLDYLWRSQGQFYNKKLNQCYLKLQMRSTYGLTYNNDISLNYPTTETDYKPYQGTTIPITFPTEAGTVYGGYVDLIKGIVVQEWTYNTLSNLSVSLTSNTATAWHNWYVSTNDGLTDFPISSCPVICDRFIATPQSGGLLAQNQSLPVVWMSAVDGSLRFKSQEYCTLTAAEFKETFADMKVCYKLKNPIIYSLTPQQLKTLRGTNNIWSSANGDVEIAYWTH